VNVIRREPTLVLSVLSGVLAILVSFGFPGLSAEQAGLLIAVVSAVIGVINAVAVRPISPAAFTGLVAAAAALLTSYGLNFSQEQVGSVQVAVVAVLALITRVSVTPLADPRPSSDVVG
jgi:hypothetical protein